MFIITYYALPPVIINLDISTLKFVFFTYPHDVIKTRLIIIKKQKWLG